MKKQIEQELDLVLRSNYRVAEKIRKADSIISRVTEEELKKRLYLAVSKYLWLGKSEPFLVDELLEDNDSVSNEVDVSQTWTENVFSFKGANLIADVINVLKKERFPDELYSILEFNMEIGPKAEGEYRIMDVFEPCIYRCKSSHDPMEKIIIEIDKEIVNRFKKDAGRYISRVNAKYENDKCIVEWTGTRPGEVCTRRVYEDGKLVKDEWCDGEADIKDQYTCDEAAFISDLGLLDRESPVFQMATKDTKLIASNSHYGCDYVSRFFSKAGGDFNYALLFSRGNKKSAIIRGNSKTAEVEYCLVRKSDEKPITALEFINGGKDNVVVQQFQDTIIKLQEHGIRVEGFEDNMESKERTSIEDVLADSSDSNGGKPYILRKPTTDNK